MAGKRAHGEGAIYKRKDGRWEGRYTRRDGKRKTIYGHTRSDVAQTLAEITVNGIPDSLRLVDFAAMWLRESVEPKGKPSTAYHYRHHMTYHVIPTLGDLRLVEITPDHVRKLMEDKAKSGLSVTTIRHIHGALRKALTYAVATELIDRNVCSTALPPRATQTNIKPLSTDECRRLITAARGDRYAALYTLAITTGMRRGEMLGLMWDDIDFQRRRVSISRSAVYIASRLSMSTPKSRAGYRTIHLTSAAIDALSQHRERQSPANDYVFVNTRGNLPSPSDILTYSFVPILKRAGLRRIRFHDLRHTCATLLLAEGIHPKVVQEQLGHADIKITLDTYSHVMPGMTEQAASVMDTLIG